MGGCTSFGTHREAFGVVPVIRVGRVRMEDDDENNQG
jgi:hypothetical protein